MHESLQKLYKQRKIIIVSLITYSVLVPSLPPTLLFRGLFSRNRIALYILSGIQLKCLGWHFGISMLGKRYDRPVPLI